MNAGQRSHWPRGWAWWWAGALLPTLAFAAAPDPAGASALRAQHTTLQKQLYSNAFKRPLVLQSSEGQGTVQGDIYAVLDFGFDQVRAGLSSPGQWCDVMILHINTKYCRAAGATTAPVLQVSVGRKTFQELATTTRIAFSYRTVSVQPDYLQVALQAKEGSLGTSDYRITLEAVELEKGKTFVHLSYGYAINFMGRLALQTYLNTVGKDRVGFTRVVTPGTDKPTPIGGVRGVVERNTMRYYLALNAYLESTRLAPAAQLEHRLQSWFTATEQYPEQLHEMDRDTYLQMKRAEIAR